MRCPTCGAPPEPKSGDWNEFNRVWRNAAKAVLLMKDSMDRANKDARYHESRHQQLLQAKTGGDLSSCSVCDQKHAYIDVLQKKLLESKAKVQELETTVIELGQQLIEAMAVKEGSA